MALPACVHVRPSVCGRSAVPTKAAIKRHERPGGTLAASGSGAVALHASSSSLKYTALESCYVESSAFLALASAAEALRFPLRSSHPGLSAAAGVRSTFLPEEMNRRSITWHATIRRYEAWTRSHRRADPQGQRDPRPGS